MSNHHDLRTWLPVTALGLCFLSMLFSGCDNTPNPNFEREIQDKLSASDNDAYAALGNAPRLQIYAWWKADQRQAMANLEAENFAKIYETALAKLNTEVVGKDMQELFASCRNAFAKAVAFQKLKSSPDSENATNDGRTVFNELDQCRSRAIKVGETDDKQTGLQAAALRRFASTGMALVGVSAIAKGKEDAGAAMWRQGDELFDEDKSGFKLTLNAFRGL